MTAKSGRQLALSAASAGWVEAVIEVRAERCGEVGSGGEAEYADAIRIDVPFGGVGADEADGALCVLKGGGRFWIWAGVGHAIFEKDAGDAAGSEPVADFGAFEIHREDVIAAAGENDDGGAGALAGRLIQRDRRIQDVAETDERFAGDEIVFCGGGVGFGGGI